MTARLLVAAALAFAALALPADAHVTIDPGVVTAGTVDTLTFRCPNERAGASTVKLVVQIPAGAGIGAVKAQTPAGWRTHVAGRTITWDGGTIAPGGRQNFTIVAGPIPAGSRDLAFKVLQVYSSGEVVRWIELRQPGEPPPPHPAPVLSVR